MSLCDAELSLRPCGRGRDGRRSSVVGSALGSCCSDRRLCGGAVAGEDRNDAEANNIMLGATEKRVSERASSQSAGAGLVFIEQRPPRARARDGVEKKRAAWRLSPGTTGGCLINANRTDGKARIHTQKKETKRKSKDDMARCSPLLAITGTCRRTSVSRECKSEGGWWVMKTEDGPVVETESYERLLEGG